MVRKNKSKLSIGIKLSCFFVFHLFSHNSYSQTISENIKKEIIQNVRIGQYEIATTILENNSDFVHLQFFLHGINLLQGCQLNLSIKLNINNL